MFVSCTFVRYKPNLDFYRQILIKVSNIEFHENLPRVSRADCADMWTDGHEKKITGALRAYARVSKSLAECGTYLLLPSSKRNKINKMFIMIIIIGVLLIIIRRIRTLVTYSLQRSNDGI